MKTEEQVLERVLPLLGRVFSRAGQDVVSRALQLYYLARSPDVPGWAKATVFAALAYLVLTPDAIPDLAPMVGFVDDLAVLTSALAGLTAYLTPELQNKVRTQLQDWFGNSASKNAEMTDQDETLF